MTSKAKIITCKSKSVSIDFPPVGCACSWVSSSFREATVSLSALFLLLISQFNTWSTFISEHLRILYSPHTFVHFRALQPRPSHLMADPGEVEPRDVSRSILPPLAPLPPQQSSSDQFHTHKATKPIGKVLPFNVDSIDPSELTLTPLPPHPPSQPQAPSPYKSNQDDTCTFLSEKPSHSSTPSTPPSDNPAHTHLSSPLPTFGHTFLPANKSWHMFVSHSTSDTQLVHESLIVPLGDAQRSVAACYNFMPDTSRYNDHEIKDAMKESVVVAIGLSPAYIHSDR